MKASPQFSKKVIATLHVEKILGIRAGSGSTHKVIGVWVVVLDERVFVRSYKLKPGGWWDTFRKDPYGEIFVTNRKRGIKVRAVLVKSETIKEMVSAAYKEKYNTPGSVGYVTEMSRSPSRDATVELLAV